MRKFKKGFFGIALLMFLNTPSYAIFPVTDYTALPQHLLNIVYQGLQYGSQLKDMISTALNWKMQIEAMKNQFDAIASAFLNFDATFKEESIFKSDIENNLINSIAAMQDPKQYLNNKLKDALPLYRYYDNCKDLKGISLEICTSETINYIDKAERLKEQREYADETRKAIVKVNSRKDELNTSKKVNDAQAQLAINNAYQQSLQLQAQQETLEYLLEEKRIQEKKKQAFKQSLKTHTSTKGMFDNISSEW